MYVEVIDKGVSVLLFSHFHLVNLNRSNAIRAVREQTIRCDIFSGTVV